MTDGRFLAKTGFLRIFFKIFGVLVVVGAVVVDIFVVVSDSVVVGDSVPVELGVESEINIEDIFKQELAEFQDEFPMEELFESVTTVKTVDDFVEKTTPIILKLKQEVEKTNLPVFLEKLKEKVTTAETTTKITAKTKSTTPFSTKAKITTTTESPTFWFTFC